MTTAAAIQSTQSAATWAHRDAALFAGSALIATVSAIYFHSIANLAACYVAVGFAAAALPAAVVVYCLSKPIAQALKDINAVQQEETSIQDRINHAATTTFGPIVQRLQTLATEYESVQAPLNLDSQLTISGKMHYLLNFIEQALLLSADEDLDNLIIEGLKKADEGLRNNNGSPSNKTRLEDRTEDQPFVPITPKRENGTPDPSHNDTTPYNTANTEPKSREGSPADQFLPANDTPEDNNNNNNNNNNLPSQPQINTPPVEDSRIPSPIFSPFTSIPKTPKPIPVIFNTLGAVKQKEDTSPQSDQIVTPVQNNHGTNSHGNKQRKKKH